ncbi:initiation control protein YabA, partial [Planococcus sp. SIMBA_160]
MDKKELFDTVINLEEQIGSLYRQLGDLKNHIGEVIEENHQLQMENQHLRERLDQSDRDKSSEAENDFAQKSSHSDIGEG